MTGWVWLVSNQNGMPHKAPDDPVAIAYLTGRGFTLTDIPGDMPQDEEFDTAIAAWKAEQDAADEPPAEVSETPIEADPATSEEETK